MQDRSCMTSSTAFELKVPIAAKISAGGGGAEFGYLPGGGRILFLPSSALICIFMAEMMRLGLLVAWLSSIA